MYLPPVVAGASLANSLHMTLTPAHFGVARTALCGVALATGIGGFGFHLYNVGKRLPRFTKRPSLIGIRFCKLGAE